MRTASRAIFITNYMAPYRVPVLNCFSSLEGMDLEVWFLGTSLATHPSWPSDIPQPSFRYVFLDQEQRALQRFPGQSVAQAMWLIRRVWDSLNSHRPDVVVVGGYDYLAYWASVVWAKTYHVSVLLFVESHIFSLRSRQRPWHHLLKRWFIRQVSAAVCYGSRAASYVVQLGLSADRIVIGCNAVDNDYFARQAEQHRMRSSVELQSMGICDDAAIVLYVGRLAPEKRVDLLIGALARIPEENWHLIVVGDGPDRQRIEEQSRCLLKPERVTFAGWQGRDALPAYYALADVFVLPSDVEEWGLVINEALASGVWSIVSDRCGCAFDLILPGINGYRFRAGDVADLAEKIRMSFRRGQAGRDRRAISASVSHCSPEAYAQSLAIAVRKAVRGH